MEKKKTDRQNINSSEKNFEFKIEAYVQGTTKLITLRVSDFEVTPSSPPVIFYTTLDGRKGILFASTFKIEEVSASLPSDKILPIA